MSKPIEATAWTLLFKHTKHTILIFAEPSTLFPKIKTELLQALRERYPEGLSATPLPDSPNDIVLATLKNANDTSEGWRVLDTDNESPESLVLRDTCPIAFTWGEAGERGEFVVEWPSYEAYAEEDEKMEEEDDDDDE